MGLMVKLLKTKDKLKQQRNKNKEYVKYNNKSSQDLFYLKIQIIYMDVQLLKQGNN